MTPDPLDKLRERIDRAKTAEPPPPPRDTSDDPLEALEMRLDRASGVPVESGPLQRLREAVERARRATAPAPPPEHWSDRGEDDPLRRLRQRLDTEAEWIGRRSSVELPRDVSVTEETADTATSTSDLESVVGREVLRVLGDEPLSPEDRRRAIERAAELVEEPDGEGARGLLQILLGID